MEGEPHQSEWQLTEEQREFGRALKRDHAVDVVAQTGVLGFGMLAVDQETGAKVLSVVVAPNTDVSDAVIFPTEFAGQPVYYIKSYIPTLHWDR